MRRRLAALTIDVALMLGIPAGAIVLFGRVRGWWLLRPLGIRLEWRRAARSLALQTLSFVGEVRMRNVRSPGARLLGLRRVELATGDPVTHRAAVVRCLGDKIQAKALFLPVASINRRLQARLAAIQPQLRDLQRVHADDKEALNRALMEIYNEHNLNPLASCLPSLAAVLVARIPALLSPLNQTLPDRLAGLVVIVEPPADR